MKDYLNIDDWNRDKKAQSKSPSCTRTTEEIGEPSTSREEVDIVSESEIETQMFDDSGTSVQRMTAYVPETQPFKPLMRNSEDGVVSVPETECLTSDNCSNVSDETPGKNC